jgi:hypothetical protein
MFGLMVWAFVNGFWGVGLILIAAIATLEYKFWEVKKVLDELEKAMNGT